MTHDHRPTRRAIVQRAQTSFRVPGFTMIAMAVCGLACYIGLNNDDVQWMETINWLVPMVVLGTCGIGAYLIVVRNLTAIWSPVPWFLLTCGIYFGFGPLVYAFGTPQSVAYCDVLYRVTPTDLLKTNLLNCVGILTVLAVLSVVLLAYKKPAAQAPMKPSSAQLQQLLMLFLGIGITTKYLFILPYTFGVTTTVLSGFVMSMTAFTTGATFLIVYMAATNRRYMTFAILYCGLELTVGFLSLAKIDVLFTLLMIFLGLYNALQRIQLLVVGGVVCMGVYLIISPIVTEARITLSDRTDKSLESRYNLMEERMAEKEETLRADSDTQYWWTRLNYANVQTYGIVTYDNGRPGSSLENTVYSIIPRWLWPSKPVQSYGNDLNEILLRSRSSNLGIGIFGEAYWNGGWIGVVLLCAFVGLEFAVLTHLGTHYMTVRDFRWVPVGVIAIRMGLRPDDWFITIYVGPASIALVFYILTFMTIPAAKSVAVGRRTT